jgi:hypothetical protein
MTPVITMAPNRIPIAYMHERLRRENCNDVKVTSMLLREPSERVTQPCRKYEMYSRLGYTLETDHD